MDDESLLNYKTKASSEINDFPRIILKSDSIKHRAYDDRLHPKDVFVDAVQRLLFLPSPRRIHPLDDSHVLRLADLAGQQVERTLDQLKTNRRLTVDVLQRRYSAVLNATVRI